MKKFVFCGLLLSISLLGAQSMPEYYRMLADDARLPNEISPPPVKVKTIWTPSPAEQKAGFAYGLANIEQKPDGNWVWPEQYPRKEIRLISQLDEFRAQPLVVRTLKPLASFSVSATELKNDDGVVIDAANIDIREVKYRTIDNENQRGQIEGNLLKKMLPHDLPADYSLWLWVTFHAPVDTPPGLYRGNIILSSGTAQFKVPVTMRVLDRKFHYPSGDWGAWIPGHFRDSKHGYGPDSKGKWWTPAPEWYNAENIVDYFKFWKSRGFTSPCLTTIYSDIKLWNGKIHTDFSELNRLVEAAKMAGLEGNILCDARFFCAWAHMTADQLTRNFDGKIPDKGSPNVTIYEARFYQNKGLPLSELAGTLFQEIIRQFDANAKAENWPHYMLFVEEEIDNLPYKTARYEFFNPILRNTLGDEHSIVIDNSIGYSRNLDRGHRDSQKYRSYNNWTREALENAKADQAVVMSFNRGWWRSSWGLNMLRINALGNHQWADMWSTYLEFINAVLPGGGKVVTSVHYERAAMGLRDLAVFRELEKYPDAGNKQLLDEIASPVQLNRYEWDKSAGTTKDADLEARRYLALSRLLAHENKTMPEAKNSSPEPVFCSYEPLNLKDAEPPLSYGVYLYVPEAEKMSFDGKGDDEAYKKKGAFTRNFAWTKTLENQHRSQAASPEDYQQNRQPVPANAAMAYTTEGLYIAIHTAGPEWDKLRRGRKSGDTELWRDDCYDLFFRKLDGKNPDLYQIIVTTADQVLLLKNTAPVTAHGIKVKTYHTDKPGYSQEIFIPWADLGSPAMPRPGERWRFNAGREYHSANQYTTWAGVVAAFNISNGFIIFGSQDSLLKELDTGSGYFGANKLTGRLTKETCKVSLVNPQKQERNVPVEKNGTFQIVYNASPAEAGVWKLRISSQDGRVISENNFEIFKRKHDLDIMEISPLVISGDRACMDAKFLTGNAEKNLQFNAVLIAENGREYPVKAITLPNAEPQRIYLDTKGLPEGHYSVFCYLRDRDYGVTANRKLQILPDPF